jgi:hypothetical protein
VANAAADAACPDGNEDDLGVAMIARPRVGNGTRGRRRRHVSFIGPLATAEARPVARRPRAAARRPRRPPAPASSAAVASHSSDRFAARLATHIARSVAGDRRLTRRRKSRASARASRLPPVRTAAVVTARLRAWEHGRRTSIVSLRA